MHQADWSRVRAVLNEVLEAPADSRPGLIAALCGEDVALRSEVESLVEAWRSVPRFLDPGSDAERVGPYDLRPDQRLGSFTILRLAGRGGQGAVYEALQDWPSRRVALKVLDPDVLSPLSRRRFEREVEAMGRLEHPGIARMYGAEMLTTDDGPRAVLIMEFIEGWPLTRHAREQGLDLWGRVQLLAEVCESVAFAHERGVVHCDLKPGNVLVEARGRPRVLDFGIARLLDEGQGDLTTATGRRLAGTLEYMSPEQTEGIRVDAQADVYALGAMLYELAAGHPPQDVQGVPLVEAVRRIRDDEPAPLRRVNLRAPRDLETLAACALAKDPARRFRSAADLGAELRRFLRHEPILTRPVGPVERARKFVRRHRDLAAGTAAVVVTMVLGTAATGWQAFRAIRNQEAAEARYLQLRDLSRSMVYELHEAIAGMPGATEPLEMLVTRSVEVLNVLAGSPEGATDPAVVRDLAVSYRQLAQVLGSPAHQNLGRPDEAETAYRRSIEFYALLAELEGRTPSLLIEMLRVHGGLGTLLAMQDRDAEALKVIGDAADLGGEACELDPMNPSCRRWFSAVGSSLDGLVAARVLDRAHAEPLLDRIREQTEAMPPLGATDDTQAADAGAVEFHLARLCRYGEDPRAAEAHLDRAAGYFRQALKHDPDDADMWLNLGDVHRQRARLLGELGNAERAVDACITAVETFRSFAAAHPDDYRGEHIVYLALRELAEASAEAGSASRAIESIDESIGIIDRMIRDDPADVKLVFDRYEVLKQGAFTLGGLADDQRLPDIDRQLVADAARGHAQVLLSEFDRLVVRFPDRGPELASVRANAARLLESLRPPSDHVGN